MPDRRHTGEARPAEAPPARAGRVGCWTGARLRITWSRWKNMANPFYDLTRWRDLLALLVRRNLRIRYKGSSLGFLWSLMTPTLMILIYALFARIMRFNMGRRDYLEFLMVGMVVWQFLATCAHDALHAISGNRTVIQKTAFPRFILPLAQVLANAVNFVLTLVVLLVFLLLMRVPFGPWPWVPIALLTQTALCFGLALILATAHVFFRDTEHILGVALLAWFFLTPVFYGLSFQLDRLPSGYKWLAFLNPMTGLLSAYRAAFLNESLPTTGTMTISFAVSWGILLLGWNVFQRLQIRFADEL